MASPNPRPDSCADGGYDGPTLREGRRAVSNVEEILNREGKAAQEYDRSLEKLPEDVKVGRPNLGRPTVVSVRLSDEEHRRLHQAAEAAGRVAVYPHAPLGS